jgi:hypothetical protein
MPDVVIDPHARERMASGGATEDEIVATVCAANGLRPNTAAPAFAATSRSTTCGAVGAMLRSS